VCYDADFYPYGGERVIVNTCSQNYKFEGKERDTETNNDDFGARYYSSRLGRWLSADWSSVPEPVPYANLTNPQTLNLYAMVSDDPESFADLNGHGPNRRPPGAYDIWTMETLMFDADMNTLSDQLTDILAGEAADAAEARNNAAGPPPTASDPPAQQQNNTTGYSTQDAAAKAGLNAINPTSIKQNKEYAGLIYKDADGNYHYITPNKGKGTSSSVGTAPDGTTVVGDYHTHGDYSRPILFGLFVVRTSAAKDAYNSDHFSDTDMAENRDSARSNPQFRGYLGTPSGALRIYNPIKDTEGPLQ
jgi:RHS repeat-associated protein